MAVRETKQEAVERKKQREEAERRNPLLKEGLGDLIEELINLRVTNNYGTGYYRSLIEEINRRERYFKKRDVNHEIIGHSLGADRY